MNTPHRCKQASCQKLAWKTLAVAATFSLLSAPVHAMELFVPMPGEGEEQPLSDAGSASGGSVQTSKFPYQIIDGHIVTQGDMVIGKLTDSNGVEVPQDTRGLGQSLIFDRWENGIITYEFDERLSDKERANALAAIAHWNENTTMSIVPRDSENSQLYPDYLVFESSLGCASWVGRTSRGAQSIWISEQCTVGSVIHEIGHAVGLFHEHTRNDRDSYIAINWDNIVDGKDFNFEVMDAGAEKYGDYDYGSIMHYGSYFFTRNNQRTITVPDGVAIGQRERLSPVDIQSVNDMYATDVGLQINSQVEDNTAQFDVTIDNRGDLGAHKLELVMNLGEDSRWLAIDANSGWECLSYSEELRCTRDVLIGYTSSQFSISADLGSAATSDLKARLLMNTKDQDISNNAINDLVVIAANGGSLEDGSQSGSATAPEETDEPIIQQANAAAGGAAHPGLLCLLLVSLVRVRRTPKT